MANMNAYEIRLNVLRVARDILAENSRAKRGIDADKRRYLQDVDSLKFSDEPDDATDSVALESLSGFPNDKSEKVCVPFDPHTYSEDDVLNLARKLGAFVTGDDRTTGDTAPVSAKDGPKPGPPTTLGNRPAHNPGIDP